MPVTGVCERGWAKDREQKNWSQSTARLQAPTVDTVPPAEAIAKSNQIKSKCIYKALFM